MRDDTRWQRAQEMVLRLLDEPADARRRELDRCAADDPEFAAWVEKLLDLDPGSELAGDEEAPRRFGPYEVVRPIGHGGMGEVFVARRADGAYEHEVAIKLLRGGTRGGALVQRFLRERQTLARLDHEYIAKLLDGGTAETGEPYLVMEYVDGEHADAYAARLELRERLELFVRIGLAVEHAHSRGVVHRDLKPANVLVRADGNPRLLDFGIARPGDETDGLSDEDADPLTRTGHRLFTPEFASPEQVRGETATPRSDLFALGVLLYVFLTDEGPWGRTESLHELERAICEVDPLPPSRRLSGTARRRLSGDLDAIVLQCLEKRPSKRYATVGDLCADVRRFLDGEPIQARRTRTLERVARYVRRRPLLPIAAVLLTLAGTAIWRAADADERRRGVGDELGVSAVDRLDASFQWWEEGDRERALREIDLALSELEEAGDFVVRYEATAAALAQKATFALHDEQWDECMRLVAEAEAVHERLEAPPPTTVSKLLNLRARVTQLVGSGAEAEEEAWAAMEFAAENLDPGWTHRTDAIVQWSRVLRDQGQHEDADMVFDEAVVESREFKPRGEPLAKLLNDRAVHLRRTNRAEEAVEDYLESLEILTWKYGSRSPAVAKVRLNYGQTLYVLGEVKAAREQLEAALDAFEVLEDEDFVERTRTALALLGEAGE
ncbi:MAG: serine/threonine-protein kinase [Planctomycetota bacterium]